MKDSNQQADVAPTAHAFLNSIGQLADDDNRQDSENDSIRMSTQLAEEFKPAPGFGAKDISAVSAMVGSRRKSRLLERSVRAPLEEAVARRAVTHADASAAPHETMQKAYAANTAPVEQVASGISAAAAPKQSIALAVTPPSKPFADDVAPKVQDAAQDSAQTILPVNQADLQALTRRIDQKLAEMSRAMQDLHIASEDNRAALEALREERAVISLPLAVPLRVVDAPASPDVIPAITAAVVEPIAASQAVPVAQALSVNQTVAPTMNAAVRMHAANANAVSRRKIPAVVWLVIAALAIGIVLMMIAPARVLVQKLGDPATYSIAGSRLGDGFGGLNTGVSMLSDRIRSLVVR